MARTNMLLGWTLSQWAAAKVVHTRKMVGDAAPTVAGADRLQRWWRNNFCYEPGQLDMFDPSSDLDLAWASKLFEHMDQYFSRMMYKKKE